MTAPLSGFSGVLPAEVLFWLAAALLVYTWAGYPLLIALLARVWPAPPPRRADVTPSVTVIIVARNEEDEITAKLESCLALDYPPDRLDILVASDGSADGTEAIVRSFAARGVRLLSLAPQGKASALNAAVAAARGEVLLLTDASEELAPESARALVAALADPTVGAVSGELLLAPPEAETNEGVSLYWRYEKLIRRSESRFDSTVGVTGALYALRRERYVPIDPRTILDDVAVPMELVLDGYRVLFEPAARAWDRGGSRPGQEYRRKTRTLAGNYQLLWLRPALLNPLRNRLLGQLLSHKVGRLLAPYALLVALAASGLLAVRSGGFYALAFLAQAAFYGLAALGSLAPGRGPRLLRLPHTFVLLHVAAATGLVAFLRGTATAGWRATSSRSRA